MTPQQLRDAAELVEQLNARDGYNISEPISPADLRSEAARMEQESTT
jgi:hypothetical protein